MPRKNARISANDLVEACKKISNDIESSKRHWLEVKERATVCLGLPNVDEFTMERSKRDIEVAEWKLTQLEAGKKVSLLMNTNG